MQIIEVDSETYTVIKPTNPMQCSECCARNTSVLCAKLSKEYDCLANKIAFAPFNKGTLVDMVNQPKHYQLNIADTTIEVRDVCKVLADRLGNKGYSGMFIADYVQMMQYFFRFDCKNGKEDLEKGRWYLDRLLENMDKQ